MGLLANLVAALTGTDQEKIGVRVVATPVGAVKRDATSLIQQRGWQKTRNLYTGPYVTSYGSWPGLIEHAGDCFRVLIKNPPTEIVKAHPKWTCFSRDQHGWWRINITTSPVDGDVNAVLHYVERLLTESFKLSGRT